MSKKVAIIGGGPAGMTAAYALAKEGVSVEVFEAGNQVGGMSRTIKLWNQRVDIGPHRFFSNDKRVNELWLEVANGDYQMVNRLTRIYYKDKFYFYPLKPINALMNLGLFTAIYCVLSYLRQKITPAMNDKSFENWVIQRFGKKLYSIFFKTYTEKLWGISCKVLDSDFAAQRIKKLSLYEAIRNALISKGRNNHKTLVDVFAYPNRGTGQIYENMSNFVQLQGGSVHLSTSIKRVVLAENKATGLELQSGEVKEFDEIISTMPITQLVGQLPGISSQLKDAISKLRFRNTIIVYLKVESDELFPDQWLYIHSPELHTGRITNFRNWIPELYSDSDSTILALEYWCYDEDDVWVSDDSILIDRAKTEIRKTGLVAKAQISDGKVLRIPRCYPVYDKGYQDRLNIVVNHLKKIKNLQVIGRYGSFKYNNQDHSILMGLLAAENITKPIEHDLWSVNTDYETYQEAYIITETGLSKQ